MSYKNSLEQIVRATVHTAAEEGGVGAAVGDRQVSGGGAEGGDGGSEAEQPGDQRAGEAGKGSGREDKPDAGGDWRYREST